MTSVNQQQPLPVKNEIAVRTSFAPSGLIQRLHLWKMGLKARYYSRKFQKLGRGVLFYVKPNMLGEGHVEVGDYCVFQDAIAKNPIDLYAFRKATLRIGNKVLIAFGTTIVARELVEVGDETKIGFQVLIMDSDQHGFDGQPIKTLPVKIGKHVWIGARSIILKGVTIGDNAIIGTGSIVTKDVPPNTIAAGVPAQILRSTTGFTE